MKLSRFNGAGGFFRKMLVNVMMKHDDIILLQLVSSFDIQIDRRVRSYSELAAKSGVSIDDYHRVDRVGDLMMALHSCYTSPNQDYILAANLIPWVDTGVAVIGPKDADSAIAFPVTITFLKEMWLALARFIEDVFIGFPQSKTAHSVSLGGGNDFGRALFDQFQTTLKVIAPPRGALAVNEGTTAFRRAISMSRRMMMEIGVLLQRAVLEMNTSLACHIMMGSNPMDVPVSMYRYRHAKVTHVGLTGFGLAMGGHPDYWVNPTDCDGLGQPVATGRYQKVAKSVVVAGELHVLTLEPEPYLSYYRRLGFSPRPNVAPVEPATVKPAEAEPNSPSNQTETIEQPQGIDWPPPANGLAGVWYQQEK